LLLEDINKIIANKNLPEGEEDFFMLKISVMLTRIKNNECNESQA